MYNFANRDFLIKFFCIVLALTCFTILLVSCSSDGKTNDEPSLVVTDDNTSNESSTMDKDIYIIDTLEDKNGQVIQKTVFNAVTKHTYIYTFEYESNAWGVVCKNSNVVIITEDGTIISPDTSIPEVPTN